MADGRVLRDHGDLRPADFRLAIGLAHAFGPLCGIGRVLGSDGGTRPYRVHLREPSFINLQATAALSIGGQVADVIASVASLDPVMGGCDR